MAVELVGQHRAGRDAREQRSQVPEQGGDTDVEVPQEGAHGELRRRPGRIHQPGDEERAHEARNAHGHERDAPAVGLLQVSAQQQARHSAERHAGGEDPHRHRPPLAGEVVRHQRRGRRAVGRLAHPDGGAAGEEVPVAPHQPAEEGERAPHGHAPGDDRAAGAEVAQDAEWQRRDREDQDVGRAEPAELRVAQREIALDRLEQRVDDVPVDVVEEVDDGQQPEGVPAVGRGHRLATVSAPPAPGCMCASDSSARRSRNSSAARYSSSRRSIIVRRRP